MTVSLHRAVPLSLAKCRCVNRFNLFSRHTSLFRITAKAVSEAPNPLAIVGLRRARFGPRMEAHTARACALPAGRRARRARPRRAASLRRQARVPKTHALTGARGAAGCAEQTLSQLTMSAEDEVAALVVDNGSGMCKARPHHMNPATAAQNPNRRGNPNSHTFFWIQTSLVLTTRPIATRVRA
jgi:hypothetical protein